MSDRISVEMLNRKKLFHFFIFLTGLYFLLLIIKNFAPYSQYLDSLNMNVWLARLFQILGFLIYIPVLLILAALKIYVVVRWIIAVFVAINLLILLLVFMNQHRILYMISSALNTIDFVATIALPAALFFIRKSVVSGYALLVGVSIVLAYLFRLFAVLAINSLIPSGGNYWFFSVIKFLIEMMAPLAILLLSVRMISYKEELFLSGFLEKTATE